jgi:hypothetical protein
VWPARTDGARIRRRTPCLVEPRLREAAVNRILSPLSLFLLVALAGCSPRPQALLPTGFLARARKIGAPVAIYRLDVPGVHPRSTGRVVSPVDVDFLVTARRPLTRLRLVLEGYDGLGLPVVHRPGHPLAVVLTLPGPLLPGKNYEATSAPEGFPGAGVSCVRLVRLAAQEEGLGRRLWRGRRLEDILSPVVLRRCPDRGPTVMIYGNGTP